MKSTLPQKRNWASLGETAENHIRSKSFSVPRNFLSLPNRHYPSPSRGSKRVQNEFGNSLRLHLLLHIQIGLPGGERCPFFARPDFWATRSLHFQGDRHSRTSYPTYPLSRGTSHGSRPSIRGGNEFQISLCAASSFNDPYGFPGGRIQIF